MPRTSVISQDTELPLGVFPLSSRQHAHHALYDVLRHAPELVVLQRKGICSMQVSSRRGKRALPQWGQLYHRWGLLPLSSILLSFRYNVPPALLTDFICLFNIERFSKKLHVHFVFPDLLDLIALRPYGFSSIQRTIVLLNRTPRHLFPLQIVSVFFTQLLRYDRYNFLFHIDNGISFIRKKLNRSLI